MSMRIVGIIPGRGGSKGVTRKNTRLIAGEPLIAYTICAAQQSKLLTTFLTTTDDDEIAEVARLHGSPVLRRPSELAQDDTPMVQVVQHTLMTFEQARQAKFNYIVVLQPTVPLRTAEDIDHALNILINSKADSVVSVYKVFDHHPARMYRLKGERLVPYAPEPLTRLRQELPPVYHRNGAIYACKRSIIEDETLIGPDTRPYIMPRERSVNIDDELDLAFAEFLMRRRMITRE